MNEITKAALIGCAINLLSTKLARDPSGRIMTLRNFYTELTALDSYCQDPGPKFSHYDPSIGLIQCIYHEFHTDKNSTALL